MRGVIASAVFTAALSGCAFSPDILRAESTQSSGQVVVAVSLRRADVETIKIRQLYFSLVVSGCASVGDGFPAEPYVQGELATDFKFPVNAETIDVVGQVPSAIYSIIDIPCVQLRGGGYFTGRLLSAQIPISSSSSGPNISIKRQHQLLRD